MRSLVAFELKKILSRRVTQVTVASLFVVLALVMALNVLQQSGTDDAGNDVSGLAAIAQKKANAEADAGLVTEERATEAIRAYQTFFDSDGQIDEAFLAGGLSDPDSFYRYENRHVAFLGLLMRPWMVGYESVSDVAPRIDASTTVSLYDKVAASVQATLDNASDTWGYTPAERDFWMQKYESTAKPVAYGYAGGWSDILSCIDFLIFAIVAACVAAAPVFAGEYQDRTDALVLSTRHGKGRLVAAKLVAAFLLSTAIYALYAAVVVGVPLAFFGADGAGLPLQSIRLSIPYDVTMAQAVGICVGIGWLLTLGMTGFTLFLSAKLRSQLAIFALCVAVLLLPLFLPTLPSSMANHALTLLPLNGISFANLFTAFASYAAGPVVFDLQTALVAAYVLVLALTVPLSARAFRRHQVV